MKPKINVVLICYNQEKFIEESLNSCLAQDYENLHIIISDDASTDSTIKIIEKTLEQYSGPHKITLNKNKENLGIGQHFSHIMDNLVNGELVVVCAGDDISKPHRVSTIVKEWIKHNKPSLVAHNLTEINDVGEKIKDFRTTQYKLQRNSQINNSTYAILEYLKFHQPIPFIGAAIAYKPSTYNKFRTPTTFPDYEDHLMYFRSLLDDGVHYFDEKLVKYRKHEKNYTSQETKPFKYQPNQILNYYLDRKNSLKEQYKNCHQTQKVAVQQWIDYKTSTKQLNKQIDYQLIQNLWENIYLRHRYLIQNKGIGYKIKAKLMKIKHAKSIMPAPDIPYLDKYTTVVFGTSQAAINLINKTCAGFKIIAACNSVDPNIAGRKIKNIPIITLEDLQRISNEIDCILIASNKYYQIKELLLKSTNIKENNIVRIPALVLAAPL